MRAFGEGLGTPVRLPAPAVRIGSEERHQLAPALAPVHRIVPREPGGIVPCRCRAPDGEVLVLKMGQQRLRYHQQRQHRSPGKPGGRLPECFQAVLPVGGNAFTDPPDADQKGRVVGDLHVVGADVHSQCQGKQHPGQQPRLAERVDEGQEQPGGEAERDKLGVVAGGQDDGDVRRQAVRGSGQDGRELISADEEDQQVHPKQQEQEVRGRPDERPQGGGYRIDLWDDIRVRDHVPRHTAEAVRGPERLFPGGLAVVEHGLGHGAPLYGIATDERLPREEDRAEEGCGYAYKKGNAQAVLGVVRQPFPPSGRWTCAVRGRGATGAALSFFSCHAQRRPGAMRPGEMGRLKDGARRGSVDDPGHEHVRAVGFRGVR